MKKKSVLLILFIIIVFLTSCNRTNKIKTIDEEEQVNEIKLNIITTNKFMYNNIQDIVKEKHNIEYMFTSVDKQTSFSFTEDSLNNISRKDLFIYTGAGFEPWIDEFIDKLSKNKVGVINSSRGIRQISYNKEVKYKEKILKENPYYWLNVDDYKISLVNIKNSIQDKDSKNRDFYENNFLTVLKNIEVYEKKYKEISNRLKDYTLIVEGDELDYFTKYLNLKTIKLYKNRKDLSLEDKLELEKNEEKLSESKNLVFLYKNEEELKVYEELIKAYNIKPVNIIIYNDSFRYVDILDYNIKGLEKIL